MFVGKYTSKVEIKHHNIIVIRYIRLELTVGQLVRERERAGMYDGVYANLLVNPPNK